MPLTQEQQDFLDAEGRIVLCAVPGSGKTYVVAQKMIKYLSDWSSKHRGIAALSFTNVASDEIKRQIADSALGLPEIDYPHFVGTLDSFINNFIFLRFGYLMNSQRRERPVIVHENYGELSFYTRNPVCNKNGCTHNPTKFYWSLGGLCKDGKLVQCGFSPNPCLSYKQAIFKKGIFVQREVPTFALRIMRKYPQIAKEIAFRFPIIIVDEAQDTSREQMEILDCLSQAGVRTTVLVGDPDQSLYEWRDATPEYFLHKMEDQNWKTLHLSSNFRSSQLICNAAQRFSSMLSDKTPAEAKGHFAAYDQKPILLRVNEDRTREDIIEEFLELCQENSIVVSPDNVAVLTRGKIHSGLPADIWKTPETESLAMASYEWHRHNRRGAYQLCEKALYSISIGNVQKLTHEEIQERAVALFSANGWKTKVIALLQLLPSPMLPLCAWRDSIKTALTSLKDSGQISMYDNRTIRDIIKLKTRDTKYPDFLDRPVIDCFEKRASSNYTLSSVHGVKGETFDATLLIVDTTRGANALTPSILNTGNLNSELMRIAYVAMTRPRKLLVVSLPKSYNKLSRMPQSLWEYREI